MAYYADIPQLVNKFVQRPAFVQAYGRPIDIKYDGVKCKTKNFRWSDENESLHEPSPVRVVNMQNHENVNGRGDLEIVKSSKPFCTLTLDEGLVKGLLPRTKFQFNDRAKTQFVAPIDQDTSEIRDVSKLHLATSIPVGAQSTVVTEVTNETRRYTGKFECRAELSGRVGTLCEYGIDSIPIEDLVEPQFIIRGRLRIDFQNKHTLDVK